MRMRSAHLSPRSPDTPDLHSFPTRRSSDLWVAHTPGSQMMTVRLKNTGLIILTGDNVYMRENVEKSIPRSEEHTSELQSQSNLVCRLLLEKKKHSNSTWRR